MKLDTDKLGGRPVNKCIRSSIINDSDVEEKEQQVLTILKEKLSQNPQQYAEIIIKPLMQGAGGMRMCRPEFIRKL